MAEPETVPYRPSNGNEGDIFITRFCYRCKMDADYRADRGPGCPIMGASLCYEIDDPKYPKEWVADAGDVIGHTARCTAFVAEESVNA